MDTLDASCGEVAPTVPGYRLGEPLGCGATGSVWSAVREVDRAAVAIKIVEGDAAALAREVDAARSLSIDHVVPVHGIVHLDSTTSAVVMDLMAGGSLREIVAARGHLSAGEAVTVLVPIAAALGALHAQGVVHGDVSPDNILFDLRGRPALADLGASHAVGQATADVWGSEGFVAPEVLLGAVPRAASDIYSLACVGLHLLTGSVPAVAPLRAPLDEWIVTAGRPDLSEHPLLEVLRDGLAPEAVLRPEGAKLATLAYAAAAPEPLVLLRDGDTVAGLTRRLRGALPDAAPLRSDQEQGRGRRWWDRRAATASAEPTTARHRDRTSGAPRDGGLGAAGGRPSGSRATRAARRAAAHPDAPLRRASGRSGRFMVAAALMLTVLMGGVAVAKAPWRTSGLSSAGGSSVDEGRASSSGPSSPTVAETSRAGDGSGAGSPSAGSGPSSSDASVDAALRVRTPSVAEALTLAQVLSDARARAWSETAGESGRQELVSEISADGSPARAQDLADLEELAAQKAHVEGLSITVRSARPRTGADASRLVLRTRSVVSAHVMVRDGVREASDEGPEVELDLVLAWTDNGWRVWEVRSV